MSAELLLGWKRYEKARKLTPRQWSELHMRNVDGENFDEMIDALPEPSTPTPPAVVPAVPSDADEQTPNDIVWSAYEQDLPRARLTVHSSHFNTSAPVWFERGYHAALSQTTQSQAEAPNIMEKWRDAINASVSSSAHEVEVVTPLAATPAAPSEGVTLTVETLAQELRRVGSLGAEVLADALMPFLSRAAALAQPAPVAARGAQDGEKT